MASLPVVNRFSFADIDDSRRITLSARDIRDAVRLFGRLAEYQEGEDGSRDLLVSRARRHLADRRKRIGLFGNSMFGEPAWDMLLVLYTEEGGQRQTVGTLANASGHAPTTAIRWLDYLEGQGFVRREAHPVDRRSSFVELTDKAFRALDAYFSGTVATSP